MYTPPIYGKEWNWRNVKMETQEENTVLPTLCWEKGLIVCMQ